MFLYEILPIIIVLKFKHLINKTMTNKS